MITGFLDTNILIYAYDPLNPSKQVVARDLVRSASLGFNFISAQVLIEFSAALIHKKRMNPTEVSLMLGELWPIPFVGTDSALVKRAIEAHSVYGAHFYDGLIIAAAERCGCSRIWSEDFNPGQKYFGIEVVNPF
ncbi:MAG: PIN domain-containing protein [Bryobacteraceae bacterium]